MTKTEEARRLASELRSVIPPKNHEASRILDSAAFTLRLLAADMNKLEAENEALRADKARLDWLDGEVEYEEDLVRNKWRIWSVGAREPSDDGVRDAIDKAMGAKP